MILTLRSSQIPHPEILCSPPTSLRAFEAARHLDPEAGCVNWSFLTQVLLPHGGTSVKHLAPSRVPFPFSPPQFVRATIPGF